ncbi:MAG: threonine synthase, partial [Clostridiales bacterium]|nr:threonine synthase [Clostridiales bacterium]
NLERLLYHISGENDVLISELMAQLATGGKYSVSRDILFEIKKVFDAGFSNQQAVNKAIKNHFEKFGYLCDTHTAVAVNVYEEYLNRTSDDIPTVIDSTASPYKFSKSVLYAIFGKDSQNINEFDEVEKLNEITGVEIPSPISLLKNKSIRFKNVCSKSGMSEMIFNLLDI